MALLLAVVTVVSIIPMAAFAAVGDIVNNDPGLLPETLGQGGSINWPVKIYDYLNDGMLFEPATARPSNSGATFSNTDMPYAGGRVMPLATLGMNYGLNAAYSDYAYATLLPSLISSQGQPNYKYSRVKAVRFEDPQHLHLTYPGTGSYNKYPLISFTNSSGITTGAKNKADIRYMVLVYRMNGRDSDEKIDFFLEDSTNFANLYGYADTNQYGAELVNTNTWRYLVIDLQTALGNSRWDNVSTVSSVYLSSSMNDSGDYLDLAMVAFYSNETEARHFGEDGADFANDPGEYLLDSQTLVFGSGTQVPEYYPSASEPGFSLKPTNTTAPTGAVATTNSTYYTRMGLNFATNTAQSSASYTALKNATALKIYTSATAYTNFTPTAMTVTENKSTANKYYITLSSTAATSKFVLMNGSETNNYGVYNLRMKYMVLVYRAYGFGENDQFGFWSAGYEGAGSGWGVNGSSGYTYKGFNTSNYATDANVLKAPITNAPNGDNWVALVLDISSISTATYMKYYGMYLPTGSGKSLDIAYVGYFADNAAATDFASKAENYMNAGKLKGYTTSGGTTTTIKANRNWNAGNNLAYGLLFSSDGATGWTTLAGGNNTNPNGYYAYAIGEAYGATATTYSTINGFRKDFAGNLYSSTGGSNQIYLLSGNAVTSSGKNPFDMSGIPFDGYSLLQTYKGGSWLTAGMLEGTLVDGKPVYRQETVEYLANLLYNTLVIPPFDADGDYNYNYVKGEKSSQFKMDINGDGDYEDRFDLNGDTYAETYEGSMDLATALRVCLGIEFSLGSDKGTAPTRGTYADTMTRSSKLMGQFGAVCGNIKTCVDAAYFLLNNLVVDNSYNQLQDDYAYLTLSSATMSDGRQGFVFDAGFTTGTGSHTQADYKENSQSAVVFSPFVSEQNGVIQYGNGTIGIQGVGSKDRIAVTEADTSGTTRFPFLPVTDPSGDYPKDTEVPYFKEDGAQNRSEDGDTYEGRNYNYVLVSNGEFVYYKEDKLYFEFEGDDDVYLFINDQLVLDIGGAHGMALVSFNLNDYVNWAREVLANPGTRSAQEIARAEALNLTEGQICTLNFIYMERKGYGANCRIVTNMQVTDPSLKVQKDAYQFGTKVNYGGVVDPGSPIEYSFGIVNTGNTKLYNLTFVDSTIGVSLDPSASSADKVLTVAPGSPVQDAYGGTLDATDLVVTVTGYKPTVGGLYYKTADEYVLVETYNEGKPDDQKVVGTHNPSEVHLTFASDMELWNFLKSLSGEGLESSTGDEHLTQQGAGLWVDGSVTIRGIYYKMTQEQIDQGVLNNTVEISATTKLDTNDVSNEILRGTASHRVYKPGQPIYYNWAGHGLNLTYDEIYLDSWDASSDPNDPMYEYKTFFETTNMDHVTARIVDKYGYDKDYGSDFTKNNYGIVTNYETAGTYSFYVLFASTKEYGDTSANAVPVGSNMDYIAANCQGKYAIVPVTIYAVSAQDSTYVLDFGLTTDTLDENGELFSASGSINKTVMGVTKVEPAYLTSDNRIDFDSLGNQLTSVDMGEGTFNLSYENGKLSNLTFTPNNFMKQAYTVWLAISAHTSEDGFVPTELGKDIDINKETQMYKAITVLPASVVYYEENFAGVNYNQSTGNSFTSYSSGTGVLTQSVGQNGLYGRDPVYQNPADPDVSGGSMWKVEIKNAEDVAKFSFTGTGFEMIGRTNATDSGIMVVKLYDAAAYANYETALKSDPTTQAPAPEQIFPVITRFDHGTNGGGEALYQVPTVRVMNLEKKAYTVVIAGNPAYDFSGWDGNPDTLGDCPVKPTYLYIDGFRVYQALSAAEEEQYYSDTEKGAQFAEMRDLVVSGHVAVTELKGDKLEVSSGTTTWTESMMLDDKTDVFTGTKVNSAADYLIQGPNNEVYMDGSVTNSAVAFYVKETGTKTHGLQIAARALDYSMFYGAGTGPLAVTLQYGVETANGYSWKTLVTLKSGTEQYYSVPYYDCPVDENGYYRVMIRAINTELQIPAMVAYSMIKTVGLDIVEIQGHGQATDLYFQDGILVKPVYYLAGQIDGNTVSLGDASYQMHYNQLEVTFQQDSTVYLGRKLGNQSIVAYKADSAEPDQTMILSANGTTAVDIPAGHYRFYASEGEGGTVILKVENLDMARFLRTASYQEETVTMNMAQVKQQMAVGVVKQTPAVTHPTITVGTPSVSFEGEIHYNIYFEAENLTNVKELGLALFDTKLENGTLADAKQVIPGFFTDGTQLMVQTDGVAPKNMGDTFYFRIYAKLTDGSVVYTPIKGYNAIAYANSILANSTDADMKALVVAMLNYGAAAQEALGYKVNQLMNAGLTAAQQALVRPYEDAMTEALLPVEGHKTYGFTRDVDGFTSRNPSVSFDGAFSINYYFTTAFAPESDVTLYYWTAEDYAAAQVLMPENATGMMTMVPTGENNQYWGNVAGIAAKEIGETLYVTAVYTAGGYRYCTGVLNYSVACYCNTYVVGDNAMSRLCAATAVYGYYAKEYSDYVD